MRVRKTVMLDSNQLKEVIAIQADSLLHDTKSISFSKTLEAVIVVGLKHKSDIKRSIKSE